MRAMAFCSLKHGAAAASCCCCCCQADAPEGGAAEKAAVQLAETAREQGLINVRIYQQ
jgi:hypothetical protein